MQEFHDLMQELKDAHEKGLLSEEEHAAAKAQVLSRMHLHFDGK